MLLISRHGDVLYSYTGRKDRHCHDDHNIDSDEDRRAREDNYKHNAHHNDVASDDGATNDANGLTQQK